MISLTVQILYGKLVKVCNIIIYEIPFCFYSFCYPANKCYTYCQLFRDICLSRIIIVLLATWIFLSSECGCNFFLTMVWLYGSSVYWSIYTQHSRVRVRIVWIVFGNLVKIYNIIIYEDSIFVSKAVATLQPNVTLIFRCSEMFVLSKGSKNHCLSCASIVMFCNTNMLAKFCSKWFDYMGPLYI